MFGLRSCASRRCVVELCKFIRRHCVYTASVPEDNAPHWPCFPDDRRCDRAFLHLTIDNLPVSSRCVRRGARSALFHTPEECRLSRFFLLVRIEPFLREAPRIFSIFEENDIEFSLFSRCWRASAFRCQFLATFSHRAPRTDSRGLTRLFSTWQSVFTSHSR